MTNRLFAAARCDCCGKQVALGSLCDTCKQAVADAMVARLDQGEDAAS